MSSQTFDSLNLAFCKNIMKLNKEDQTIELMPGFDSKKLPLTSTTNLSSNSIKKIQTTAYRLGIIFAKTNDKNIQINLNISI